ncbi:Protein PAL1 like protein [Verticillium longisporum]|uniref:Protein PAL1 like protein n=1 Tax=Verticillium longisporum TaxID=100787 RepID=A0A8I2ZAB7_VERLO|nr:Protein PAL1 like protein [Verticillium longisporum]
MSSLPTFSTQPGSQPSRSAGLTLNLSSNNPFRNRAASPAGALNKSPSLTPTATSPFDDPNPPPRPVSRNPFLDPNYSSSQPNLIDLTDMSTKFDSKASPTAEELFDTLTIEDKKPIPARPTNRPPPPPGRENMPPPGRRVPPPGHRPTRSQEEALRARRMQGDGNRPDRSRPSGPTDSPHRRPPAGRPRRNSESSVLEKPMPEEEKKAREARRRERERRHREGKDKEKKPQRKLDVIDQLDHTSLFGGGFHHDGPFDAVNPNRNRKGSRRAPMQAFPEDSLNMSLGGSGPLNKNPDHATFMGNGTDEAFKEYSTGVNKYGYNYPSARGEMPVFDPSARTTMLHGEESLGLGTSTFLEGTPATRTAIQKLEAEQAEQAKNDGMQRKKSLAHRIRNLNGRQPREFNSSGRMTNPEAAYPRSPPDGMPPATTGSQYGSERNPFFNEYGKEGETITVKRTDSAGPLSPISPPPPVPRRGSEQGGPLERRTTIEDGDKPSGGFLSRVKSLKGGRRNRQVSDNMPPGTAA